MTRSRRKDKKESERARGRRTKAKAGERAALQRRLWRRNARRLLAVPQSPPGRRPERLGLGESELPGSLAEGAGKARRLRSRSSPSSARGTTSPPALWLWGSQHGDERRRPPSLSSPNSTPGGSRGSPRSPFRSVSRQHRLRWTAGADIFQGKTLTAHKLHTRHPRARARKSRHFYLPPPPQTSFRLFAFPPLLLPPPIFLFLCLPFFWA